ALELRERRDHGPRDVAPGLVRLQPLEHLEAVQLRHHDVEEHEIERPRGDALKRLASVGRLLEVAVTLAPQPAAERVAVVGIVVDDQDGGIGHAQGRDPSGSSAWILARRLGILTGLASYSSQPASSAFSRSPGMAWAERAMIGMVRVSSAALRRRVASQPSSTGRLKSIRIRSGRSARASAMPCSPSAATTTSKPDRCRRRVSMYTLSSLSST